MHDSVRAGTLEANLVGNSNGFVVGSMHIPVSDVVRSWNSVARLVGVACHTVEMGRIPEYISLS